MYLEQKLSKQLQIQIYRKKTTLKREKESTSKGAICDF